MNFFRPDFARRLIVYTSMDGLVKYVNQERKKCTGKNCKWLINGRGIFQDSCLFLWFAFYNQNLNFIILRSIFYRFSFIVAFQFYCLKRLTFHHFKQLKIYNIQNLFREYTGHYLFFGESRAGTGIISCPRIICVPGSFAAMCAAAYIVIQYIIS